MVEVGLAHRSRKRTAPTGLMEVQEHPVNDILSILKQRLSLSGGSLAGFEFSQNSQIAVEIVAVPHAPACIDPNSGTFVGGFQVACVTIEPGEIDHCLTHGAIEFVFLREVTRLLKILHRLLSISRLKR